MARGATHCAEERQLVGRACSETTHRSLPFAFGPRQSPPSLSHPPSSTLPRFDRPVGAMPSSTSTARLNRQRRERPQPSVSLIQYTVSHSVSSTGLQHSPRLNRGEDSRRRRIEMGSINHRNPYEDYTLEAPLFERTRADYDLSYRIAPTYDHPRREHDRRNIPSRESPRHPFDSDPYDRQQQEYEVGRNVSPMYDQYRSTQEQRHHRIPYRSTIDERHISPPIRTAYRRTVASNTSRQRMHQYSEPPRPAPPSVMDHYSRTVTAFDEWEDSFEPDSDQLDIEVAKDNTMPKYTKDSAPERPFTEARFLPLCRAIKASFNNSYYALAEDVEERLLTDDVEIFHKIKLDSFRQYVYEAKKCNVPIAYTSNVDDQVKRIYFCLTKSMVSPCIARQTSRCRADLFAADRRLCRQREECQHDTRTHC